MLYPLAVQNLINRISQLPDIGPRAATRLVFYLMSQNQEELNHLSDSIKGIKKSIKPCPQCFNISDANQALCPICQDGKRDASLICVVENVMSIPTIEKTNRYQGLYHVLGGLISPASGVGPDKLKIDDLAARIKKNPKPIREIIFAFSPTTEGDTTALYIEKTLQPLKVKTSRLARGLSMGADLEYIDENTLSSAFLGRK